MRWQLSTEKQSLSYSQLCDDVVNFSRYRLPRGNAFTLLQP